MILVKIYLKYTFQVRNDILSQLLILTIYVTYTYNICKHKNVCMIRYMVLKNYFREYLKKNHEQYDPYHAT